MVLGPRHNDQMPRRRPHWPLAVGLAAGVALDALLGDPRRGHPVAAFGRAAAALEARDYADSRPRGAAHAAACVLAVAAPAALLARGTRGRPPWQAAAAALAVWAVTGARSLHREAERIMAALARHDLACGAARAAQPLRPRSGQPGGGGDDPGRDRVGRREHVGRGGGAAAVGGRGRAARTGRLPRGQHPRRHGGLPVAPVPALRLGLGPPGRRRELGSGPGHRRARPSLARSRSLCRGRPPRARRRGTSCARTGQVRLANRPSGRREPSQPERRPLRGRIRRGTRRPPRRHERYGGAAEMRPGWGMAAPRSRTTSVAPSGCPGP